MRTAVLTLALAVALPSAVSAAELRFPVGGFDRIALGGSPDVIVTTGRSPGVVATGEQAALDRLDIRVVDGVLQIGTKRGGWFNWSEHGHVRIAVTVPMVRGLSLGGSGTIKVDHIKVPAFAAELGGSGTIAIAALDAGKTDFSLGGSGSLSAAGSCDSASASVGGSGALQLGALKCQTLDASVGGSGRVDAFARRNASLSVAGSGDIVVRGGARCAISKVGSGSARCIA